MTVHPVFAHALGILTAPPKIGLRILAERGPSQKNRVLLLQDAQGCLEPDLAAHQVDARDDGPRRVERIDLPNPAPLHADLAAVIVDGAQVSVAPPGELEGVLESPQPLEIMFLPVATFLLPHDRGHALQDVMEEEAEPDALASAEAADLVEPVIPVAGPHERQAMGPHTLVEHEIDCLETVPVDGIFPPRPQGIKPHPLLSRRQGRKRLLRLQVTGPLLQQGIVVGRALILDHSPDQPEEIVRGVGPPDEAGPAILEAMEPVHHVSLDELLGRVQQDLSPRQYGIHPDQVHGILELISKTVGPAGLVKPPPRPDALCQRLIFSQSR